MSIKNTTTISIIFVLVIIIQHAHGASHTQFFKVKPLPISNKNNKSPYYESLPKGVPIPPSSPSKRHNGINLKRYWP